MKKEISELIQFGANTNVLSTTQYAGGIIYENGVLEMIPHAEGYTQLDPNGNYQYVYQYKDHLGNVRLSYSDINNNGSVNSSEILSEKHYYPFGLQHKGYGVPISGNSTAEKFGFGGKEIQDELGLKWMDFQARNYDAAIGRWMNIDPLADDSDNYEYSPYNYTINNPIFFVDPDGMKWKDPKEAQELRDKVQAKRDMLSQASFDLISNYLDNGDFSDKAFDALNKSINKFSSRISELDGTLNDIDVLGADEVYEYDLTTGNKDSSHVKSSDGINVSIEGGDDGLKVHEIRHAAKERRAGRLLLFEDNWKLKVPRGFPKFDHEISGYRSQWGFDGQGNTLIKSDGSIRTNGGGFTEYGIQEVNVSLYSRQYSILKLGRNKNKSPGVYTVYKTSMETFGISDALSKEILMNSRLSR